MTAKYECDIVSDDGTAINISPVIIYSLQLDKDKKDPYGTLEFGVNTDITIGKYKLRNFITLKRKPQNLLFKDPKIIKSYYTGATSHFKLKKNHGRKKNN